MSSTALGQLRNLHLRLYEKAFSDANAVRVSPSLRAYAARFDASLPQNYRRCQARDMIAASKDADFLLYGDFHTLKQSQRGFLRILRDFRKAYPKRPVLLAMELFRASDQGAVDAWLSGRISEADLLKETNYFIEWGFPWSHYRMLLEYARAEGIRVFGINTNLAGRDSLTRRDKFAAHVLMEEAQRYPEATIFTLIGEYHLAPAHLPKSLREEARRRKTQAGVTRVLANVDRYYLDLHKKEGVSPDSTEVLELGDDFYCVLNSPPWIKWQTYTFWEETRSVSDVEEDDSDRDPDEVVDGESFDVDYHFLEMVRTLTDFLGMKSTHIELGSFSLHLSPEADFASHLEGAGIETEAASERMMARAAKDGQYVIPQRGLILLTDPSINNMAEAAGQYLQGVLGAFEDHRPGQPLENFYRRVMKSAVGMVASKILNPRRKGPHIQTFESYLVTLGRKRPQGTARRAKAIAQAVVRHHEWMKSRLSAKRPTVGNFPKAMIALDRRYDDDISVTIGRMLGMALYREALKDQIASDFLRMLFMAGMPDFETLWTRVTTLYRLVDLEERPPV